MINYEFETTSKCNKMSLMLCVTEGCARDRRQQDKRLVGDYRHYRPLWGESKYETLIKKRPSDLENKIRLRIYGLVSSLTFPPAAVVSYSGVNVTLISSLKRAC